MVNTVVEQYHNCLIHSPHDVREPANNGARYIWKKNNFHSCQSCFDNDFLQLLMHSALMLEGWRTQDCKVCQGVFSCRVTDAATDSWRWTDGILQDTPQLAIPLCHPTGARAIWVKELPVLTQPFNYCHNFYMLLLCLSLLIFSSNFSTVLTLVQSICILVCCS